MELISKDGAIEAVLSADETNGTAVRFSGREIITRLEALPTVETTSKYDDFHEDIKRLTKELEHYQSRCELLKSINDTQVETIRTYAAIVNILEKELKELKGELT